MNTIQETKGRLRGLSLALATILDNYGVNSNQQPEYNVARQELEDIIANMADAPPPAPVTVDSVVAGVMQGIAEVQTAIYHTNAAALTSLGEKVDSLIALANAHGEAQQAAPAA
ncbi:MAG: hypothetical protein GY734_15165 [Herbaspirillum sp.]|uniref:hypothetical protein n=1 Tax=Herbaspirillum sp. TaxID=1890675 RepID=UPI00258FB1F2|nr:hypothetical protein [Herbaspirillum sp.]MCP3653888.1 hypothetical protein [Herbaspirillum sp.]MCP3947179.1 hypothetical protein [Herbaspirillum sp.]MCP4032551.1 hypothetical protein [Herbaspirillum sp.]MCP4555845.1 hypothetical protein [Herbaspirillum sp.]